ncbi:hypothetical protein AB6F55_17275 [Providencia hangzhouensis]
MKKMIVLLALSLFSYQGLASGNKVNFQPVSNKIIENNSSTEPHRKILVTKTFVGDASLSSIEMQAQQEAKKLGKPTVIKLLAQAVKINFEDMSHFISKAIRFY